MCLLSEITERPSIENHKSKTAAVICAAGILTTGLVGWGIFSSWLPDQAAPSAPVGSVSAAPGPPSQPPLNRHPPRDSSQPILYTDVTEVSGVTFRQTSGMTADKYFPTAHGSGVAMLDYDADGRLDLHFSNARQFPLDEQSEQPPHNVLYRQCSDDTFEDVSLSSRLAYVGFGQGIAVGDVDNDGFPDVYLANYAAAELFHNQGDGTFETRTTQAALDDSRWATSAGFLDFDRDGNLDLYVARYARWKLSTHVACGVFDPIDPRKIQVQTYCNPKSQTPERHSLYRSLGDGRFVDVLEDLGIARDDGRGQGVVAADVNGDGLMDLYVANDQNPNFLFVNNGRGGFEDVTDYSGAALNARGQAEAGMGVDCGDVDGDGQPELFVTNFYNEHNTLYKNLGQNLFVDVSYASGVAAGSIDKVGWGTALEDFDQDGWLDILVVNGHVDDNLHEMGRDEPYREPSMIWRNLAHGAFQVCEQAGSFFQTEHVSRGAAFGDVDNDGDVDAVITHKDDRPTILRNDSRSHSSVAAHGWIQFRLVGTASNRDAVGASSEIFGAPMRIVRQIQGGRSYLSAHDLRLTIGLGAVDQVERVVVRWPSGAITEIPHPALRQLHTLREPHAPGR